MSERLAARGLLSLSLLALAGPAQAGGYEYAGTYQNEARDLQVTLRQRGTAITGTLTPPEMTIAARIERGALRGGAHYKGLRFELRGRLRGRALVLVLDLDGEYEFILGRVDSRTKRPPPRDLARRTVGPSPWAGTWLRADGGVGITLQAAQAGYSGTITLQRRSYSIHVVPSPGRSSDVKDTGGLRGIFRAGARAVSFSLRRGPRAGSLRLTFADGGESHVLYRPGKAPRTKAPRAKVYTGRVAKHRHPYGYYSIDLPVGWGTSGVQEAMQGIISPLRQEQLMATIVCSRLDPEERSLAMTPLVRHQVGEANELLRTLLGIAGGEPRLAKVEVERVGGQEIGWARWSGLFRGRRLTLWLGLKKKEDDYGVAILGAVRSNGRVEAFTAGLQRALRSVQLLRRPPQYR